jgi:hypothetical protein
MKIDLPGQRFGTAKLLEYPLFSFGEPSPIIPFIPLKTKIKLA